MRYGVAAQASGFRLSPDRPFGARRLMPILLAIIFSLSLSYGQSPKARSLEAASKQYYRALTEGESQWRLGNFPEAFPHLISARELAQEMKDARKEVVSLMLLGKLCWALGRLEDSQSYYAEALSGARRLGLEKTEAEARRALDIWELYARGQAHLLAGQYKESIADITSAADLARAIGSREHEIKCLRQLGLGYWAKQDQGTYLSINERSLEIARELNDRREQTKSLISIGSHYLGLSDYSRALNYYSDALDLSRDAGDARAESVCQKNISIILNQLGFPERALDCSLAAHDLDQRLGSGIMLSHGQNNLGEGFLNRGLINSNPADLYEALGYFTTALESATRNGDRRTEMRALNNIGNIHLHLEKYHSAQNYFRSTLQIAEEVHDTEALIGVLNNLGICGLKLGNCDQAQQRFQEALDRGSRSGPNRTLWESSFYLGQCLEQRGAYSRALACYEYSMDAIDFIRSQIVFDDYKVGFMKNKFKVYEAMIDLLGRLEKDGLPSSRAGEIFAVVERAKARAFLETLDESTAGPGGRSNPLLTKKEEEISGQISSIVRELSRNNSSPSRIAELQRMLKGYEEEYLRLVSRMRMEGPGDDDIIPPVPLQLAQVQERLLDNKTAILEYFLGEKASLLFLITKKDFSILSLPPRAEIEKSIGGYLELLSNPPRKEWKGLLAANRLARDLLSSIPERLPGSIDRLVFIPDGKLSYLPFETLPLPPGDRSPGAACLISKYAVSYAPSCSSLMFLKARKKKGPYLKGLLAVGNPAYPSPFSLNRKSKISVANIMREIYEDQGHGFLSLGQSEREIKEIARFFSASNRTLYLKREASEEMIKRTSLEGYQIIHFACHGFFDDKIPLRSALVLSFGDGSGGEGFLQVREVANLRLAAELVVLSACETGRGPVDRREGILGLTRAFFFSGARSVVSSLWEIGDQATAEFMRRFYYHLSREKDKAQALRLAKLSLLQTRYSAPFYWAAFILNGDPSTALDVH